MSGSLTRKICSRMYAHFPPRPGKCLRVNRTGSVLLGCKLTRGCGNRFRVEFSSAGPAGRGARFIRSVGRSVG